MFKYIKPFAWSLLLTLIYALLQYFSNKLLSLGIINLQADYADPKAWTLSLYASKLLSTLIGLVIPVFLSLFVYFILYKYGLKEKIIKSYGFSKTSIKNIIIGILLGITLSVLSTVIFNNHVWYDLIYNGWFTSLKKMIMNFDTLVIIRNTILIDFFMLFPTITLIPLFEEMLFRGLIFNEIRKCINVFVAIIVQAFLFGIIHLNMLNSLKAFIVGILLAVIFLAAKSIWVPIVVHIFYNLSILFNLKTYEFSSLLGSSNTNTTEIIDSFVYNSLNKSNLDVPSENLPLWTNIILVLLISSVIAAQITFLWKTNRTPRVKSMDIS